MEDTEATRTAPTPRVPTTRTAVEAVAAAEEAVATLEGRLPVEEEVAVARLLIIMEVHEEEEEALKLVAKVTEREQEVALVAVVEGATGTEEAEEGEEEDMAAVKDRTTNMVTKRRKATNKVGRN